MVLVFRNKIKARRGEDMKQNWKYRMPSTHGTRQYPSTPGCKYHYTHKFDPCPNLSAKTAQSPSTKEAFSKGGMASPGQPADMQTDGDRATHPRNQWRSHAPLRNYIAQSRQQRPDIKPKEMTAGGRTVVVVDVVVVWRVLLTMTMAMMSMTAMAVATTARISTTTGICKADNHSFSDFLFIPEWRRLLLFCTSLHAQCLNSAVLVEGAVFCSPDEFRYVRPSRRRHWWGGSKFINHSFVWNFSCQPQIWQFRSISGSVNNRPRLLHIFW